MAKGRGHIQLAMLDTGWVLVPLMAWAQLELAQVRGTQWALPLQLVVLTAGLAARLQSVPHKRLGSGYQWRRF